MIQQVTQSQALSPCLLVAQPIALSLPARIPSKLSALTTHHPTYM